MISASQDNPWKLFFRCKLCGFYLFWEPDNDEINQQFFTSKWVRQVDEDTNTAHSQQHHMQSIERTANDNNTRIEKITRYLKLLLCFNVIIFIVLLSK